MLNGEGLLGLNERIQSKHVVNGVLLELARGFARGQRLLALRHFEDHFVVDLDRQFSNEFREGENFGEIRLQLIEMDGGNDFIVH